MKFFRDTGLLSGSVISQLPVQKTTMSYNPMKILRKNRLDQKVTRGHLDCKLIVFNFHTAVHECLLYLNNQSTVSTAKRLASDTINGYEFACIWNSKYNEHVFMIQTNADFIFKTHGFCLLLTLNCEHLAQQLLPLAMF